MEQLKLNMIPSGVNPVFHASQYDKGRQIGFVIDETLSNERVSTNYTSPDGTTILNVQYVTGDVITDTIPDDILKIAGIVEGEVRIDGIGSLNFFVEVEKDAYDGGDIVTQTATGAVATFETNIETAFASLTAEINPVQDLHGYTKPWSGGGGKNKLPLTVDGIKALNAGTWSGNSITLANVTFTILTDTDGNVTGIKAHGTANAAMLFIIANFTLPSGNYSLNGNASGGSYDRQLQLVSGATPIASDNGSGSSFTLSGDTNLTARIRIGNGQALSNVIIQPMVRDSSASADFEPYSNICPISGYSALNVTLADEDMQTVDTKTVNFGQTIYGGVADVTGGKITVTHKFISLNGSETWVQSGNSAYINNTDAKIVNEYGNGISDQYAFGTWGDVTGAGSYGKFTIYKNTAWTAERIAFALGTLSLEDFKTALSNTPVTLCYELATPTEISTTPENLTAISGENNVYADTNGDTEVEYYIEV